MSNGWLNTVTSNNFQFCESSSVTLQLVYETIAAQARTTGSSLYCTEYTLFSAGPENHTRPPPTR